MQPNFALLRADVQRFYPQMRMYGADAAAPWARSRLKAEAAYFTSTTPQSDDYALCVLQLERQTGEWSLVGRYAGQVITERAALSDSLRYAASTRAFVARAGYTIDVNRSVAFEAVVRQNGEGAYLKAEYSQAFGQHWRATAGFALIRGE